MADRRQELARRARRDLALTRPEFRKPRGPVVMRASTGATSPNVRELAEDVAAAIAAFRARERR